MCVCMLVCSCVFRVYDFVCWCVCVSVCVCVCVCVWGVCVFSRNINSASSTTIRRISIAFMVNKVCHALNSLAVVVFDLRLVNERLLFQAHSYILRHQICFCFTCALLQFGCQLALALRMVVSDSCRRVAVGRMHYLCL